MIRAGVPSRGRRAVLRASGGVVVLATLLLGGMALRADAAVTSVVIDDFGGTVHGSRTVTVLPGAADAAGSKPAFDQAGGVATLRVPADAQRPAGIRLDYAFDPTDLTVEGASTALHLEFGGSGGDRTAASDRVPIAISVSITDRARCHRHLPDDAAAGRWCGPERGPRLRGLVGVLQPGRGCHRGYCSASAGLGFCARHRRRRHRRRRDRGCGDRGCRDRRSCSVADGAGWTARLAGADRRGRRPDGELIDPGPFGDDRIVARAVSDGRADTGRQQADRSAHRSGDRRGRTDTEWDDRCSGVGQPCPESR